MLNSPVEGPELQAGFDDSEPRSRRVCHAFLIHFSHQRLDFRKTTNSKVGVQIHFVHSWVRHNVNLREQLPQSIQEIQIQALCDLLEQVIHHLNLCELRKNLQKRPQLFQNKTRIFPKPLHAFHDASQVDTWRRLGRLLQGVPIPHHRSMVSSQVGCLKLFAQLCRIATVNSFVAGTFTASTPRSTRCGKLYRTCTEKKKIRQNGNPKQKYFHLRRLKQSRARGHLFLNCCCTGYLAERQEHFDIRYRVKIRMWGKTAGS
mmetsp:Transcript_29583/g.70965  ORF Transcript_29583/g.70965 Transcript_29583/m.70965 type:complete len:260 (-) Transcript_29583:166-945(-)